MEDVRQRRLTQWICLALALVTLALYSPTLRHEFLDYDDDIFVTKNEHVQKGFTGENFIWAFTNFEMALWHPLTWFSHMADYKLFGLKAGGHHFTGVLLHAANSVLIFLVLRGFTRRTWPSAIVAALFAWHPLHVESVAWVSERKDVLSCFFWLLTMGAYLLYVRQPGWRRYCLMVACFSLGLMAKPMLVTLPFVLLLLDFWPLQRLRLLPQEKSWLPRFQSAELWRCAKEKIPLLLIAVGVSALTIHATKQGGALMSFDSLPLPTRLANAVFSYGLYLVKMCWPAGLSVFYPIVSRPGWQIGLAGGALLIITGVVFRNLPLRPYLAIGWFWYLGTLVPAIQIIQTGGHAYADRYTYIPLIGIFLMLVWGIAELAVAKKWPAKALQTATGAALAACLVLSTLQISHWKSITTLFTHSLAVAPTLNYVAHGHLGGVHLRQGQLDEAIFHYSEAVKGWSKYIQAHNNLGAALFKKGRVNEAVARFREAIKIQPTDADAHYNLGIALSQQGKVAEAVAEFVEAVRIKPAYADARTGLGTALLALDRVPEAVMELSEALRLKSGSKGGASAGEHLQLANALGRAGQLAGAAQNYAEALRLQPDNYEARINLAQVLDLLGRHQEALAQFEEIQRRQPGNLDAASGIALSLLRMGKTDEAIARYQKLIAQKPDRIEAHNNLGWALAAKGRHEDAIKSYNEALRLNPNNPDAHNNLAISLNKLGRPQEAIPHFEATVQLNPGHAGAHTDLGLLYLAQGKFTNAAAQFDAALKLKPGDGYVHYQMGIALVGGRQIKPAIEHLRLALQYRPDLSTTFNALAWILAAHPDPKIRNGEEAVKLATRAVELSNKPVSRYLNTLAVAQAEAGKFDEAIATAQKALETAQAAKQNDQAAQIQKELPAFQLRRAYRDPNLPR